MLVLTRKKLETLRIGEAKVIIQKISGHSVTLAIDAPRTVRIVRGELVDRDRNKEWEKE